MLNHVTYFCRSNHLKRNKNGTKIMACRHQKCSLKKLTLFKICSIKYFVFRLSLVLVETALHNNIRIPCS